MAKILNERQEQEIKQINKEINNIKSNWLCEGSDDYLNALFNNKLDVYFLTDYNGNIVKGNIEDIPENERDTFNQLAKLYGKQRLAACDEYAVYYDFINVFTREEQEAEPFYILAADENHAKIRVKEILDEYYDIYDYKIFKGIDYNENYDKNLSDEIIINRINDYLSKEEDISR